MRPLERWTLANGMTVLYERDPGFPLASGTLLFRVGSRQESYAEAGLCSMTMDLLQQGTRHHTARQIAEHMESVGASLGTQCHEDYSELGFIAPASEIDRALDLAAEVLQEPSFPEQEIMKEKAHVTASLKGRRDAIFNFAYDHFNHMLYEDHPYGRPLEGRPESVKTFKRSHFQTWHQLKVRPEQGIFSLVAPFPGKDVLKRLNKTLGSWRVKGPPPRNFPPTARVQPLRTSRTRHERSPFEQAYLMVGWQAPGAFHQDQIPLKVLNTIMGGGMSSRLFVQLREKLGLAYEVSSFYPSRQDISQWVIYLGLPGERLKTAAQRLNELLEDLGRRGTTVHELRQAQAMIRGAFLMDSQSRRRQAWYRAWWEFLRRGENYGEEFLKAVDAVTPADILRVAKETMAQPRVTVTVEPK